MALLVGRFEQLPVSIQDFVNKWRAQRGMVRLKRTDKVSVNPSQLGDDSAKVLGPIVINKIGEKVRSRAKKNREMVSSIVDMHGRPVSA